MVTVMLTRLVDLVKFRIWNVVVGSQALLFSPGSSYVALL